VENSRKRYRSCTPLVIETAAGAEAIVNSSERIEAFDPETGKSLWQYNLPHRFAVPMPVFHNGMIYLNRGYRSSPVIAIRPGGRGDITGSHVAWNVGAGAPYVSSLIHQDGLLFYVTEQGIATCLDAKNGERVWQDSVGGVYSASPVSADGKVYLFSESGDAVVLKAARTPQVLARNKLDGRIIASPAVAAASLCGPIAVNRHGSPAAFTLRDSLNDRLNGDIPFVQVN
jgi:outer membrane protein assembly factor BamB